MKKVKHKLFAFGMFALLLVAPGFAFADDGASKVLAMEDLEENSYTHVVANWPEEQDGKKSLAGAAVIELDENVRGLADSGDLIYNFQLDASCDECRSFDWSGAVVFKDASKKEISRWSDSGSDYSTYRQSHSLGGSGLVPKGTVYVEITAKCSVGTKSDLTLESSIVFSTTANLDPQANGNSFTGTVVGDKFDGSGDSAVSSSQSFYFDYLKDSTCYADDVDLFATIYLDAQAKELAEQGLLHYTSSVSSSCGECRTMHNEVRARCFDANNKELPAGQWVVSEADYETFPQDKTFQSGTIFIPEGTAYITLEASNEMTSTNSHLGLYGSLTVTCVKSPTPWDENVDGEGQPLFAPSFSVVNAADGQTLSFTDVFNGYSKRVSADDRATLFRSAIFNQGVLFKWAQFAYDVFKVEGAYWDHSGSGYDAAFGAGHYTDLLYQFTHQTDGSVSEGPKDSNAWSSSTGLQSGDSMDDVVSAATNELAAQRKKMSSRSFGNSTAEDFQKYHDIQAALDDRYGEGTHALDGIEGPLYYSIVTTTDQRGGEQVYYYNSFALVFYDFEYAGVVDGTTYSIEPVTSASKPVAIVQSVTNDNGTTASLTSNYSHTESSTATNTLTSTSTASMTQTYGLEGSASGKFSIKIVEVTTAFRASGQWALSDAFSFSKSISESETVSDTIGSSSTTEVPPYAIGVETTTTSVSTVSQEYDCPIAVRYKVMLIGLNGQYYDDGVGVLDFEDYEQSTLAVAVGYDLAGNAGGSSSVSAQDVLRNEFASTGLNEASINALGKPSTKYCTSDANLKTGTELLADLKTNIPSIYEDAVYADTATSVDYAVNVYPSRPLAFTSISSVSSKLLEKDNTIYVSENASYDLSNNIGVAGYVAATDASGGSAKYVGFSMSHGSWKVYAKDGSPVDDGLARVAKNPVSGHTMLELGNVDSVTELLLVYHIDDNVYSYITSPSQAYGENGYTSDKDLTVRASLNVVVEPAVADEAASPDEPGLDAAAPDEVAPDSSGDSEQGEAAAPGAASDSDQGASSGAASLSVADMAKHLVNAWASYVAIYGLVDEGESLTEQQLINMAYAAYCVATAHMPEADPRDEGGLDSYSAEAAEWAKDRGFDDACEGGADTLGEAKSIIMDYLYSLA